MADPIFLALLELLPLSQAWSEKCKGACTNVLVPASDRDTALKKIVSELSGEWEIKKVMKLADAHKLEADEALEDDLVIALRRAEKEARIQWTVFYTWNEE